MNTRSDFISCTQKALGIALGASIGIGVVYIGRKILRNLTGASDNDIQNLAGFNGIIRTPKGKNSLTYTIDIVFYPMTCKPKKKRGSRKKYFCVS